MMNAEVGLAVLEKAFRELFGPAFDEEMRAHAEKEAWYSGSIPAGDLLRYRVQDNVERSTDSLWVFESLRVSERRFLAEKVGIDINTMLRVSPSELANAILVAVGLPTAHRNGIVRTTSAWTDILSLIREGQDEKAAVLCRQKAERFLRTLAHFYSNCGRCGSFIEIIQDPGSLVLPRRLQTVRDATVSGREEIVSGAFAEDDWADLGFLTLLIRKVSARLEKQGDLSITGQPLILMTQKEQLAFELLSKALQPYAHDKPTKLDTRRKELDVATSDMRDVVVAMASRQVVPDELVVLETCTAVLGPIFRGILENGAQLRLTSAKIPAIGTRALFIPATRRDYSRCEWVASPWPPE